MPEESANKEATSSTTKENTKKISEGQQGVASDTIASYNDNNTATSRHGVICESTSQFPIFESAFQFHTVSVVNSPISAANSSNSEITATAFGTAIYQNPVSLTPVNNGSSGTTPRALVMATTNSSSTTNSSRGRKRTATSRLPAKLKEPAAVARRNARERRRVKMVNDGFLRLRKHVPTDPKNKKLSKVKTLRLAIDYIKHLQQLLVESSVKQTHTTSTYNSLAGIPDDLDANTTSWLHSDSLVSNFTEFSSNFTLV
eukprot:gene12785-14096_t